MSEASIIRPPKGLRRPVSAAGDLPVGREAITLPLLLLTVAALGGVRVTTAGSLVFVPPSLMSLVLGVLLVATLVRSGALAPERLMSGHRTPLENASGITVAATLVVASAQVFTLVTPAAGFLAFVFTAFYVLLLWNTLAVEPDRRQLFRSLLVVLGGAFVLKFVILAAMYDPSSGLLRRVVLAMVEGVSLGALGFVPDGSATGYLAFVTLAGFFLALILLPGRRGVRTIS
jgi:hypothetical protein